MPVYEVTAPDGRKLRITAPEGATQEDALAYAQQHLGETPAPQKSMAERYAAAGIDPNEGANPTQGMSGVQKFMAGVGKSFVDTGEGLGQLVGLVPDSQVAERRRLDEPLMHGAGLAGNIVGQTAQIAIPVPAGVAAKGASLLGRAAPYAGAAARSGLFSAAQGTVGNESRLANGGLGALAGAGGQAINAAGAGLARGAISRMEPAAANLARKAEGYGLNLGLPALSDNPLVRTVASQMERLPFSGATKRARANQSEFNRQVAKTIGVDSDKLTPDVFAQAKGRLQNAFETLTGRNDLTFDTGHVSQIKGLLDEVSRLGGSDTARMVKGWAHELFSKVDAAGKIPGKAYQSFDSRVSKVLKAGGEPAYYLGQLRDIARGAMDASVSAKDRAAWALARKQYAALKTVEPLAAKATDGNISPQALMGRVTADSAGKIRMASGKGGDLGDLARIGQRFLKAAPNSGTADRLLVNAAVGGGLYGAQQQGLIDPGTAAAVGGGLLLNRLGLNALNSRALAAGDSRALNGLARLVRPAPYALPAAGNATGLFRLLQGSEVAP